MSSRVVFNISLAICGLILASWGFYLLLFANINDLLGLGNFINDYFYIVNIINVISWLHITFGIVTLSLAIADSLALSNKYPMTKSLFVFCFVWILVVTMMTAIGMFAIDRWGLIDASIEDGLRKSMVLYDKPKLNNLLRNNKFAQIQNDLKCCGYTSYLDWRDSKRFNDSNHIEPGHQIAFNVPDSCCVQIRRSVGCGSLVENLETKGCLLAFFEFKNNLMANAAYSFIWIVIFSLGGLLVCLFFINDDVNYYVKLNN